MHPNITHPPSPRISAARVPKGSCRFSAALASDDAGNQRSLSLSDALPGDVTSLSFLHFDSLDPTGRQAYWLTTAYLLGAALSANDPNCSVVRPRLIDANAGGAGFSLEYLRINDATRSSEKPSSYSDSVQAAFDLVGLHSEKPQSPSADELAASEKSVADLAARDLPITTAMVSKDEAVEMFSGDAFRLERIYATRGDQVKVVHIGQDYHDIAPQQPLLPSTGLVKAIKLTEWSTATFTPSDPTYDASSAASSSSSSSSQHMQLLRGVSFPDKKQLKAHLQAAEDAAQSSHHAVGKAQALFFTHAASPGTPFMLPHGVRLARKMERVVRDLYDVYAYDEVITPQLYKRDLWVRSGHWHNYRDDMFGVEGFKEKDEREAKLLQDAVKEREGCCAAHGDEADGDSGNEFGLKPMNCPGHCLMFASSPRTIRDLPIRYAEFSPLHRNESSGSLSGLTRVRRFHQDDAHVFCAPAQVSAEISTMLSMLTQAYDTFGFPHFELVLSTRPAAFIGAVEEWDRAEQGLREALDGTGRPWELNAGDGAFYGPKIDVRLVDAMGRRHQTATIQLDFQLPQRFDLSYEDGSGSGSDAPARPVMIHRAILGSVERFMAILIESRKGGDWPFWLNPRQAVVLPVAPTPTLEAYARRVRTHLALGEEYGEEEVEGLEPGSTSPTPPAPRPRPAQTFHVAVDSASSGSTLNKRIRTAQVQKSTFTLVVGEREAREGTVSVRLRQSQQSIQGGEKEKMRLREALRRAGARGAEWEGLEDKFFPAQAQGQGQGQGQDLGVWRLEELRRLFEVLDRWHL